jgi:hypothetical protein
MSTILAANLLPVSTTPWQIATDINDTSGEFATCINDAGGKKKKKPEVEILRHCPFKGTG